MTMRWFSEDLTTNKATYYFSRHEVVVRRLDYFDKPHYFIDTRLVSEDPSTNKALLP